VVFGQSRVEHSPQLWSLGFWIPPVVFISNRKNSLFCSRTFFVTPATTEDEVESLEVQKLAEALGPCDVGVAGGTKIKWVHVFFDGLWVGVNQYC